jgi:drug/metabolite transporter (DMT)-like permease
MALPLPALAVWAWVQQGPPVFPWSSELLWILLYNGPLATGFAFWASVSLQRALPSITISLSYLAVPVCGVLAATLWLGENLTAGLVVGGPRSSWRGRDGARGKAEIDLSSKLCALARIGGKSFASR